MDLLAVPTLGVFLGVFSLKNGVFFCLVFYPFKPEKTVHIGSAVRYSFSARRRAYRLVNANPTDHKKREREKWTRNRRPQYPQPAVKIG